MALASTVLSCISDSTTRRRSQRLGQCCHQILYSITVYPQPQRFAASLVLFVDALQGQSSYAHDRNSPRPISTTGTPNRATKRLGQQIQRVHHRSLSLILRSPSRPAKGPGSPPHLYPRPQRNPRISFLLHHPLLIRSTLSLLSGAILPNPS